MVRETYRRLKSIAIEHGKQIVSVRLRCDVLATKRSILPYYTKNFGWTETGEVDFGSAIAANEAGDKVAPPVAAGADTESVKRIT